MHTCKLKKEPCRADRGPISSHNFFIMTCYCDKHLIAAFIITQNSMCNEIEGETDFHESKMTE